MVSIIDFQTFGYIVSNNGYAAPEQTYGANDDHHRVRTNNYCGHAVVPWATNPALKQINMVGGADTVYLPFYQDKVSSVKLPTAGPDFFVTDNMSGCAFYIGKKANGQLVVFHSNSQLGSDKATMEAHEPSFQGKAAATALDTLVTNARADHVGVTIVATLSKSAYLGNVDRLTNSGAGFIGGTTIAGFRTGTTWEFWVQNWGSVNGGPVGLLRARKFYG